MELYKYQGAGNDFLIADNRDGNTFFSKEINAITIKFVLIITDWE